MTTGPALGVGAAASVVVLYDGDCPLCRSLAAWVSRRSDPSLILLPWSNTIALPPWAVVPPEWRQQPRLSHLRLIAADGAFEGQAAWERLLRHDPGLSSLSWLAARLGLVPQLARGLERTGTVLRRFCRRCPAPD